MHYLCLFIFLSFISACSINTSSNEAVRLNGNIEQQQLLTMQSSDENFLLLDVRSSKEFNEGHIPGSMNISHQELADRLAEISLFKDKNVVVYCRSGRRAGIAIDILKGNNFQHLSHLSGDMQGWQAAELDVVKN